MKLHEITQAISKDPHAQIKRWLEQQGINKYTIRPDGVVDVHGDVDLRNFKGTTLPIQFGKVSGLFYCDNTNISSLKGFPEYIGKYLSCENTKIKSLTGVDKVIKHISGMCWCDEKVTHILGLLLIEGITHITISGPIDRIMNKYLGTGDILSAQDELIDAGLTDQARL